MALFAQHTTQSRSEGIYSMPSATSCCHVLLPLPLLPPLPPLPLITVHCCRCLLLPRTATTASHHHMLPLPLLATVYCRCYLSLPYAVTIAMCCRHHVLPPLCAACKQCSKRVLLGAGRREAGMKNPAKVPSHNPTQQRSGCMRLQK
jgi:hypothetical protein